MNKIFACLSLLLFSTYTQAQDIDFFPIEDEAELTNEQVWLAPTTEPAPSPAIQQAEAPASVPAEKSVIITLRSPTNGYLQCESTDSACLDSAVKQGYMPLQNVPQFAGFRDILGRSDYPAGGKWRNNNNIPRW